VEDRKIVTEIYVLIEMESSIEIDGEMERDKRERQR
jgi:hypothetical protein